MAIDALPEKVRKEVSEPILFADDLVMLVGGGNDFDTTEYLESSSQDKTRQKLYSTKNKYELHRGKN